MKKLVIAGILAATASLSASATVLDFDDSSFNDGIFGFASGVTFDNFDLAVATGTVTQVGSAFSEVGLLSVTNFNLGLSPVSPNGFPSFKGYEILMDYSLVGTAGLTGSQIDITFSGGYANLYADTTVDGIITGGSSTLIGTLNVGQGACTAYTTAQSGACDIRMGFTPVAGYFALNGVDLLTHKSQGAGIWMDFVLTVQGITGFNPFGTPFSVTHDGNVSISVPEPTSIAILGLGLLGFAGARRRKS